ANPGTMVEVPAGRHEIDRALRITAPNTGLYGYGTIVQSNAGESIVEIVSASGVRISGLTLTRGDGSKETSKHAIAAYDSADVTLENVRLIDNCSNAGTIVLERCRQSRVQDCTVTN